MICFICDSLFLYAHVHTCSPSYPDEQYLTCRKEASTISVPPSRVSVLHRGLAPPHQKNNETKKWPVILINAKFPPELVLSCADDLFFFWSLSIFVGKVCYFGRIQNQFAAETFFWSLPKFEGKIRTIRRRH